MDYKIYSQYSITFDDVLLSPGYSTIKPKDVNTSMCIGDIKLQIPIISAAMDTVTESKMAINLALNGGLGVIHRNMSIEKQAKEVRNAHKKKFDIKIFNQATFNKKGEIAVGAAIGVENNAYLRLQELIKSNVDIIFIDVAHAHTKTTIDFIKKAKKILKKIPLVVGNIATKEAAKDLIKAGVDVIKVGIGPGSICTTRIIAGIGVPQISAILEIKKALAGGDINIIADGGIRFSGDIAKAIAAGADSVMLGSLFAGTEEAPGKVELFQGRSFKTYRGMGSIGAMTERDDANRYLQEDVETDKLVPEGIEGRVPYKGLVINVINQLIGGVRQSMGYIGCKSIKDMQNNSQFVEITNAGMAESHVHDVMITKEAPNYQRS